MSFETLKVAELRDVAEYFGVELDGTTHKADIIAAIEADGVTWDQYVALTPDAREQEATDVLDLFNATEPVLTPGQTVLVRMVRANPHYETFGHVFTKTHPFVVMSKKEAQKIFDNEEGFRVATPKEVEEYYS